MTRPESGVAAVYSRCAPNYDTGVAYFRVFGQRLVDLVAPAPGERVLDVAAGRGACLFPAARAVGPGGAVHGVDLSTSMVAHLRADISAEGVGHASAALMDAQALDVPAGSYDAAVCAFALFLMPDPRAAAAGMLRALRPGGRCGVSVPAAPVTPGDDPRVGELYACYLRRAGVPAQRRDAFGMDAGDLLTRSGCTSVRVREETRTLLFADTAAWWEWAWTVSTRGVFERLPGPDLEELRRELFALLESSRTAEGLPATARVTFATGERPQGD
ncbi:O-methyltransferase/aklanonic acid methyltransferase [Murinocardiopsis flavida]|uniref:O-methyltransferase/aklanonic acid methyltransferase n=1 Tax=Murinocardiopsis flavida TaxID=645275 RepID=A0A2P8CWV7_9ACTN|nr:methyltransferase domain-containing protein [Murinocardiopsis flavida]PSK89429.1 O-methyltransferase/aklanonic acid methyltransferase [Murinocardiopsis flavida]